MIEPAREYFEERLASLRRLMKPRGADAALVLVREGYNWETCFHLSGFRGSSSALLILDGEALLVTDGRYLEQASEQTDLTVVDQGPGSILEAARIDGAGAMQTFVQIVLPMVAPGIGALAIFTFISAWNDYFMQLLMLNTQRTFTISVGIATLQAEMSTDFGLIMAGAAVAAVPIVVVFLMYQRFFTRGITMGAVKG